MWKKKVKRKTEGGKEKSSEGEQREGGRENGGAETFGTMGQTPLLLHPHTYWLQTFEAFEAPAHKAKELYKPGSKTPCLELNPGQVRNTMVGLGRVRGRGGHLHSFL